jgi:hypothetical protein
MNDKVDYNNLPEIPTSLSAEEVLQRLRNELRHHIVSIQGYSSLLLENYPNSNQQFLSHILTASQNITALLGIVDKYLDNK